VNTTINKISTLLGQYLLKEKVEEFNTYSDLPIQCRLRI
jgi:hypothetical protein